MIVIELVLLIVVALVGAYGAHFAVEGNLAIAEIRGLTGDAVAVREHGRVAIYTFVGAVTLVAAARGLSVLRRGRDIGTPLVLPAVLGAAAFGLCVQLGYGDPYGGSWTGPEFANGVLLGAVGAALLLVVPVDLVSLLHRGRNALGIGVILAFIALKTTAAVGKSDDQINFMGFQPIELVKVAAVLYIASFLGSRASKLRFQRVRLLGVIFPRPQLLIPALLALIATFLGLFLVGDFGPTLILGGVFLGLFYVVTRSAGWLFAAVVTMAAALLFFCLVPELAPNAVQLRIVMLTDPWFNGRQNGDQLVAAFWAMAAGGLTGSGLGSSWPGALQAGHTDLVYAHLVEELGWLGGSFYLVLLMIIIGDGLRVAFHNRTPERVLMAAGLALLLLFQAVVILGGTLGVLPLTGVVAPFLSYGKTSMITFLGVAALLVRLARDGEVRADTDELRELRGSVRELGILAAAVLALMSGITGLRAAWHRDQTTLRGAVTTLAEGQPKLLSDPRISSVAAALRRGSVLDRNGEPLASSPTPDQRLYPLGDALGTVMGPPGGGLLRAKWSIERIHDTTLRGYGALTESPAVWLGQFPSGEVVIERVVMAAPSATMVTPTEESRARARYAAMGGVGELRRIPLSAPDYSAFLPIVRMKPAERIAAVAALADAVEPRTVRLTLDSRLQALVAREVRKAAEKSAVGAAAAVVLDPRTGEVLARAQWPDYDPGKDDWRAKRLKADPKFMGIYGAWSDKTGAHGIYQAGSVFKVLTALTAIRAGLVEAADSEACPMESEPSFVCNDVRDGRTAFSLPGWKKPIHDFGDGGARGKIDLVRGITSSSNVYFGQLALALGPGPYRELREAGVEFGNPNLLKEPETEFTGLGTANSRRLAQTGFGQGAGSWSVSQAARLVGAIANGGVYRRCPPDMLFGAACEAVELVPPGTSLAPLLAGMQGVMKSGTGARLPKVAGVRIYGKTGTADAPGTRDEAPWKIKRGQETRPHSWFIAIAEPDSAVPCAVDGAGRYVVTAVVPHGGFGAAAAGPLVINVIKSLQELSYLPPAAPSAP